MAENTPKKNPDALELQKLAREKRKEVFDAVTAAKKKERRHVPFSPFFRIGIGR